jgi:acetyl-CoA carboxylase carboxyl transferase subunit beta
MNWITNYVRPKLGTLLNRRETPDNLWVKCGGCSQMVFHRELAEAQQVCPYCAHHMGIIPEERFARLFDDGKFETVAQPETLADPLGFRDEKRYTDRLKDARRKTSRDDAVLIGKGKISGVVSVAAASDFQFMGGSMGMAVGNAFLAAAKAAVEAKAPLIIFSAAGGARMQEGILSLMQMPRTTIAVQMVREAGLPYISVFTHPTTGGVTASYAMLGDVQISEPNALICFAGPRVIEQTIREKLPEGFQRAEYLLEHGMLDMVVDRRKMAGEIGKVVRMLMRLPAEAPALPDPGGDSLSGIVEGAPSAAKSGGT